MRATYLLLLAAACGGGGGGASAPDAPSPDAPTLAGPTLTARPGQNLAHLAWTTVPGASSYNVYRSNAKGTQGPLAQSVGGTTLDDTAISNFEPEWYEVTGVVGGVETQPSNQANAFGYDLSHWTIRREALRLDGFAYAPANATASGLPIYVTAGFGGAVLTSNDGTTWTAGPHVPGDRIDSLTFGNGQFVAGGYTQGGVMQNIFTSPDGITWTVHDSGYAYDMDGMTYGFSGSVATPYNIYVASSANGTLVSSPDGAIWTTHACGTGELYTVTTLSHLAGLSSQFVMVAAGFHSICTSTDGVTWTAMTLTGTPATATFISAAADPATSSVWLVATSGFIYQLPYNFSTHAFGTATSTTVTATSGQFSSITAYVDAASVHHVVATTDMQQLFATTATTATGFAAVAATVPSSILAAPSFQTLGTDGTALFMMTQGEQVLRSTDGGASFTILRDDPGGSLISVVSRDGLTVANNDQLQILTSTDNATFAVGTTGTQAYYPFPLAQTQTGFAAVYLGGTSLEIFDSTDAQTWSRTDAQVTACSGCTLYSDGVVVQTDNSGYLVTMSESPGPTQTALAITGSATQGFTTTAQTPNAAFVQIWRVGSTYYGLTNIYYTKNYSSIVESADGITWTTVAQFPSTFYAARYFDDGAIKYVVDDYGKVSTSTDGTTWSTPAVLDPSGRAITRLLRLGDHLIAVGYNGLVSASLDGVHWSAVAPGAAQLTFYDAALTDRGLALIGLNDAIVTAP